MLNASHVCDQCHLAGDPRGPARCSIIISVGQSFDQPCRRNNFCFQSVHIFGVCPRCFVTSVCCVCPTTSSLLVRTFLSARGLFLGRISLINSLLTGPPWESGVSQVCDCWLHDGQVGDDRLVALSWNREVLGSNLGGGGNFSSRIFLIRSILFYYSVYFYLRTANWFVLTFISLLRVGSQSFPISNWIRKLSRVQR